VEPRGASCLCLPWPPCSSIEFALLAASVALVLFEVMQVPAQALGDVLARLFQGSARGEAGS